MGKIREREREARGECLKVAEIRVILAVTTLSYLNTKCRKDNVQSVRNETVTTNHCGESPLVCE